jgi:putative FmdB family regulatory protein
MPIYRYACTCGYKHDQFLKQDKQEVLLKCLRCGKNIMSRQVRDASVTFAEKDMVTGVMRNEKG